MAYAVLIYVYFCRSCRRWKYVVNNKGLKYGREGEYKIVCRDCGHLMKYRGKVRVVLPYEDYTTLVERKVLERAPVPLPRVFGGRFKSWRAIHDALSKEDAIMEVS
jgi:hypothetical protein